jgi:DNA-binding XRE family transcriptional regulator
MEATTARLDQASVGARVAAARRKQGMTQRDLAEAVGTSTWTIDRIENGAKDAGRFLPSIAEVTHASREWLVGSARHVPRPREREAVLPHLGIVGRDLVLASIVLLVTIRFFTEVVSLLPRAANFIDVPICLMLAFAALATAPARHPYGGRAYFQIGSLGLAFLFLSIISATVNSTRTAPAPVLVFVYEFLSPFVVYAAVYRIWPPGNTGSLSRTLVALGLTQLVVVALVDVPRFREEGGNPDFISGTFGTNQYQLVFFLLVVAVLLAGIFTLEPGRTVARFAPLIILANFGVMIMAQYRALLLTTVVTILVVGVLLGRHARGIVIALFAVVAFAMVFSIVASRYPELRLGTTASTTTQSPWVYVEERYEATRPVRELYVDEPYVAALGTGPGTFSSRAWQTFSQAGSTSYSNVQGGYAQRLTGGLYSTDVSNRYVESQVRSTQIFQGSGALAKPYSSYLGLIAEVGVLGLLLIVLAYVGAMFKVGGIARKLIANTGPCDESVPALALATTIGFLTLLQMGILENWLEVTRITFIVWIMFAVVAKEVDSRRHLDG